MMRRWIRWLATPAAALAPWPAAAQTTADTVSVYEAVLADYITEGLAGTAGPVHSVCAVRSSVPRDNHASARDEAAARYLGDPLPELSSRQRQVISTLLRERHGLAMADICEGYRDDAGRQGAYLDFSGPRFYGRNVVVLDAAITLGNLRGHGDRCRWERAGEGSPWRRTDGCMTWVSDQDRSSCSRRLRVRCCPPFLTEHS